MTRVGTVLGGKYEILKQIGQGGMSVVYVALDIRLNKQWAVKEMKRSDNQSKKTLLKSLQMEANILKCADHPVLPRIVDIIDWEGTVFVVMDYIEGHTLSEIITCKGAQPQDQVIAWAKDLCSALNYLHSMEPPIIYRDIKPSNIMIKPDGSVKLIDFGAAKELDTEKVADTTALGTRGYAAPEQFGDANGNGIHKTDERTDIYNLGATLYHVVTGKNPGEPPYGMRPIREWNPALSKGLEKIICKCTMANPKERYQSCPELIYALEHYKEQDDVFKKECFRRLKGFLICITMVLCFGIVTFSGYIGIQREQNSNYESLLTAGYHHVIKGEYEEAATLYMDAITKVDGSRNEAYLELLNLYINHLDDPETGLYRVACYIDREYCHINENQQLLLRVAMDYFDILQNYKTSVRYFNLLDGKEYPMAAYYSAIAVAMSELHVDYGRMGSCLKLFEEENDKLPVSENRFMNYKLLCIVYNRSLNEIEKADEHLVAVAQKGLNLLEHYDENHGKKTEYYTIYNQYMAQGYEHLGERTMEFQKERAVRYYEKAIICCDLLLGIIPKDEKNTVNGISNAKLREAKYCQKADILQILGRYEDACDIYDAAKKEYTGSSIDIYTGYLSLLCKMQEQVTPNVEQWDYKKLYTVYKQGEQVPGILEDYRWKQLSVKLAPLWKEKRSE